MINGDSASVRRPTVLVAEGASGDSESFILCVFGENTRDDAERLRACKLENVVGGDTFSYGTEASESAVLSVVVAPGAWLRLRCVARIFRGGVAPGMCKVISVDGGFRKTGHGELGI